MTWMGKHAPTPATILQIERGKTNDRLTWYGARDLSGADYLLYNIYASDTWPVDTQDPRNLVASRYRYQSLTVPHHGHSLYYAVTATDRYGNESAPKTVQDLVRPRPNSRIDFRSLIVGKQTKKTKKQTHFK